jgi:hypothetical protein
MAEKTSKNDFLADKPAVIVDTDGRVLASFSGAFGGSDARETLKDCRGIGRFRSATVVEGEKAIKIMKQGRG